MRVTNGTMLLGHLVNGSREIPAQGFQHLGKELSRRLMDADEKSSILLQIEEFAELLMHEAVAKTRRPRNGLEK